MIIRQGRWAKTSGQNTPSNASCIRVMGIYRMICIGEETKSKKKQNKNRSLDIFPWPKNPA